MQTFEKYVNRCRILSQLVPLPPTQSSGSGLPESAGSQESSDAAILDDRSYSHFWCDALTLDWSALRYQHAAALRAV